MNAIGHNSAFYGEQIGAGVCPQSHLVLAEDHPKLFRFVKWNIGDYISGTQGMTVEQEGIYMRFLVRLYDRGKPFPDDDRFMTMILGLSSIRVWKRIKQELIAIGKIICRNFALTNGRFERERIKRAEEIRKQADAAKKRWDRERQKKKVSPKFAESLPKVCSNVSANKEKKVNGINDGGVSTHMPSRIQNSDNKESPNGLLSSDEFSFDQNDPPCDGKMTASKAARMAFDLYNQTAERCGLPKARMLNKARARALALRVKEANGLDGFKQALANLEKSSYCRGQNDRGWVASIDYVCQPKGFAKLFEGGWGNGAHSAPVSSNWSRNGVYTGKLI